VFIKSLASEDILYFPGVLQADPGTVRDHSQIFRLFCHEAQRVFHDRLINDEDKRYFNTILAEMSQKHFSQVCVKNNC
jgi:dynein heavy chain